MTDDIVVRLRDHASSGVNCLCGNPACEEAADEIERLRAALREIAYSRPVGPLQNKLAERYEKIAYAALAGRASNDASP